MDVPVDHCSSARLVEADWDLVIGGTNRDLTRVGPSRSLAQGSSGHVNYNICCLAIGRRLSSAVELCLQ